MHTNIAPKSIRHLATIAAYGHACNKVGICFNGNQMERYFSNGAHVRTGLFNKHITKGIRPSFDTVSIIEDKASGTMNIFCSPIWDALELLEHDDHEIFDVLELQDIDVMSVLFERERNYDRTVQLKPISKKMIWDLRRIASPSALAALILLRQQKHKSSSSVSMSKHELDETLLLFLVNTFACDLLPYRYCGDHILSFLENKFCWQQPVSNKRVLDHSSVLMEMKERIKISSLMRRLRRSWTEHEFMVFFSRMDEGVSHFIKDELEDLSADFDNHDAFELKGPSFKCLYWVMKKVNNISPDIDKFCLIEQKNRYFLRKLAHFDL